MVTRRNANAKIGVERLAGKRPFKRIRLRLTIPLQPLPLLLILLLWQTLLQQFPLRQFEPIIIVTHNWTTHDFLFSLVCSVNTVSKPWPPFLHHINYQSRHGAAKIIKESPSSIIALIKFPPYFAHRY